MTPRMIDVIGPNWGLRAKLNISPTMTGVRIIGMIRRPKSGPRPRPVALSAVASRSPTRSSSMTALTVNPMVRTIAPMKAALPNRLV